MNRITYRWVDGVRGRGKRERAWGRRRKKTARNGRAREGEGGRERESEAAAAPRRGWKRDRRQQSTDRSCDTPLRHRRNNWLPHGEFEELSRVPRAREERRYPDGGIPGSAGGGGRRQGYPAAVRREDDIYKTQGHEYGYRYLSVNTACDVASTCYDDVTMAGAI